VGSTSSNGPIFAPHQDKYIGRKLADRYAFSRVLGEGGTGTVYLCEDLLLCRKVAVKTILPALADNLDIRRRIDRECRLHAAIGVHPNIVTLYDKLEQDGQIFLIMEYVRGEALSDILRQKTGRDDIKLKVNNVVSLVRQLLQAIGCIHDHGILHRDIKTSNILICRQEENNYLAKLMDFGIARMEENGKTLTRLTQLDTSGPGTPTYMAPERIDPQKFGESCPATDLYSVGVILYQLLSDGPPFTGTISEIFNGHLHRPVDLDRLKGDVSSSLRNILCKALAKKPEDRFNDAASFAQALAKETGPISLPSMNSDQEEELTLPIIESPGSQGVESTLLAPEPKHTKVQSSGPERQRHYLILFAGGLLCCFIFFMGFYFFNRSTAGTPHSHGTAIKTDRMENRQEAGAIKPVAVSRQNTEEILTTAMDALQESRAMKRRGSNGLTIDGTIDAQQSVEDSDWQVLESSASRIDKK
jgi:serine/threonine-protein kinase